MRKYIYILIRYLKYIELIIYILYDIRNDIIYFIFYMENFEKASDCNIFRVVAASQTGHRLIIIKSEVMTYALFFVRVNILI